MSHLNIDYEMLFSSMIVKDDWKERVETEANRILAKSGNYVIAANKINKKMPWHFVGIVHDLECGLDFNKHMHNGDSLKRRTVNVPAGRPLAEPMNGFPAGYTWIESCIDAFTMLDFDKEEDWSVRKMLYRFESYNGFGYEKYHNMYSPYLWSGTNHYDHGKYDTDGHWNNKDSSKQAGAAPLLLFLTDKTKDVV